ncbi:MAG: alpha-L-arabinofuranosidase [Chloroflexi bacterium]|nr:alpha-L-arabinofuranosidase [Chloroflexota bacterium]
MKRLLFIFTLAVVADFVAMNFALVPTRAASDLIVYDDALQNGFQDWSWAPHSLTNTSPISIGVRSISVSFAGNWDGVWFVNPGANVDTSAYTAIQFAIHGGSAGGQTMEIKAGAGTAYPTNAVDLNAYLPGGAVANQWRVVTIPLSALGLQNALFANIAFQSKVNAAQPTFYLDDIRLVAALTPPGFTATIRVDANASPQNFDSRVLGSNLPAWLGPTRFNDATVRARTMASGVTLMRIPGGSWSDSYDWLDCENGGGNCSWASRPTDFINSLRATGNDALFIVNVNDTSKKAAAAVAFFNSYITDTTPIGVDIRGTDWYTAGHWAQLRASHGNVAPFKIRYWDFGNEIYGSTPTTGGALCASYGWENGWTCDGTEYVNGVGTGATRHEGYLEFRNAMRAVDATILVGAVGVPDASSWSDWGNKVIAAAGNALDFYIVHEYAFSNTVTDYNVVLTEPHGRWNAIKTNLQNAFNANAGGRQAPIFVDEYNLFAVQDVDNSQLMTRAVNALFIADTLGQIAQNNFATANQWDLMNGAAANGTDFGLMNADTYARTPQYYVFPLWSRFGAQMLPVTTTLPATTTLSVYAGRINAQTLSLIAINKTGSPITATIQLAGAPSVISGTADVVRANALSDQAVTFNGVSNPSNDLSSAPPASLTSLGNPLTYTFAPYSITLLRMQLAPTWSRLFLPFVMR